MTEQPSNANRLDPLQVVQDVGQPLLSALHRTNSEGRPTQRSRARFCIDQCSGVTIACALLIAATLYLIAKSENLNKSVGDVLLNLLALAVNVTTRLTNRTEAN